MQGVQPAILEIESDTDSGKYEGGIGRWFAERWGSGIFWWEIFQVDSSYEEYFTNWAKVWCLKAKPEYLQLLLNLDVHGPSVLRANMPPRNFDEWYKTFDVKETDQMYIAPEKRVVIW